MAHPLSKVFLAGLQVVMLAMVCVPAKAGPTSASQARQVVRGWLRQGSSPLGSRLGPAISRVETFSDETGQALYHVVYLQPNGFVIVTAEDQTEPIVCFASSGTYDPSWTDPLGALVGGDVVGRVKGARGQAGAAPSMAHRSMHEGRWRRLSLLADGPLPTLGLSGISDIRVAPFVQSRWSQETEAGQACYNYYTPPGAAGSASNYPCGCVATAMAQVMRYFQYPVLGIGVYPFTITVNGVSQTAYTRGGDGVGGPYDYTLMMLDPNYTITAAQREAIGALCYDAGVAVGMRYASDASGAYLSTTDTVMVSTFRFSNSVYGYNYGTNILTANLQTMLNPNLDAGFPVILGIQGQDGSGTTYGHAVLSDGYGYDSLTLYHHLNMGWGGYRDAWYNLPTVDPSLSPAIVFTKVTDCVYNIYPSGSGEIISGRVTDAAGNPLAGLTVTAQRTSGGTYSTTTGATGVFACAKVPSSSTYVVSVTGGGYTFSVKTATTGKSRDNQSSSGNYWGLNFQANATAPAAPSNPTPGDGQTAVPLTTTLSWTGEVSGVTFDVYLDTANPPVQQVAWGQSAASFSPAVLEEGTTYYWKVVAINTAGQTPGPVWSLRTRLGADIDGDGYVNVGDLQVLVAAWASGEGPPPSGNWDPAADINDDGYVNVGDLQMLVAQWGQS